MNTYKKLTSEQTQKLYDFTRKHYVEYYDLQTEFVQELAKGIEEQWKENPDEEFEIALEKEFKKYGIFGFTDIVEKRHKALEKRYIKLVLGQMWKFFKSSKLIWIILIIAGMFAILHYWAPYNFIIFVVVLWGFFLFSLVKMFRSSKKYNRKVEETGKRWLFREIIYKTGNFSLFFIVLLNLVNIINNFFQNNEMYSVENIYIQVLMSIILVFLGVLLYLINYRIPKNVDKYCDEFYEENKKIVVG